MVLPNNGQFESREILHTGTTGIGTAGTSKRAETMPIAAKTSAAFAALFMPVDFHRPRLRYTHLSEWEESLQVRFRGEAAAPAMRVDNHSHIILAPIGDMVAAAKKHKIDRYSITEHVSQFRPMRESVDFGSVHRQGRIFESLKEYRAEFSKVPESAFAGMKLRKGLEVDFSPCYEARVGEFVNQEKWDVLLCSVHEFADKTEVEGTRQRSTDRTEAARLWHEYFRLQQMALESDFVPFAVLTHPTRLAKGIDKLPEDLDDFLLDLAKTAKRRGKALELNGNDLGYVPGLVRRVAAACSRGGCSVSLGSDSHLPQEVFRKMKEATSLVDEFSLQPV